MNMNRITPILAAVAVLTACGTPKSVADTATKADRHTEAPNRGRGVRAMPFAYIYRTNGDYNYHVTVNTDQATGDIVSFPAITDVNIDTAPMVLNDGWLLDRRGGVGKGTAFLKWTYAEYRALPATPRIVELRAAIIPGAHVTEVHRLDMTTFAAQADTAAVNRIIREQFTK